MQGVMLVDRIVFRDQVAFAHGLAQFHCDGGDPAQGLGADRGQIARLDGALRQHRDLEIAACEGGCHDWRVAFGGLAEAKRSREWALRWRLSPIRKGRRCKSRSIWGLTLPLPGLRPPREGAHLRGLDGADRDGRHGGVVDCDHRHHRAPADPGKRRGSDQARRR